LSGCSNKNQAIPDYLVGKWLIEKDNSITVSKIETNTGRIDWARKEEMMVDKILTLSASEVTLSNDIPRKMKLAYARNYNYVFENEEFGNIIVIKLIDQDHIRVDWSTNTVEYYKRQKN